MSSTTKAEEKRRRRIAFLSGGVSAFDIFGYGYAPRLSVQRISRLVLDDQEAIRRDWEAIGNDLRIAARDARGAGTVTVVEVKHGQRQVEQKLLDARRRRRTAT